MPKTEKISRFNQKYGTKLTQEGIVSGERKFQYLDNFLFEKTDKNIARNNYFRVLSGAFIECVEGKMALGTNYSLADVKVNEFIKDFEGVMVEVAENNEVENRQPYEGIKAHLLIKRIKEVSNYYNKTLPEIWAKGFKDGAITIDDFKDQTIQAERGLEVDLLGSFVVKDISLIYPVTKNHIKTILSSYEAISDVRESRGFFWKLFHPIQNHREKKLLEELGQRKNALEGKGLPLDALINELRSNKVLDGKIEEIDRFVDDQKRIKAEEKAGRNSAEKKEPEITVAQKFEQQMQKEGFKETAKEKINGALIKTKYSFPIETQKRMVENIAYDQLINAAKNACLNYKYYSGNKAGQLAGSIFAVAYKVTESLGHKDIKDRIVAAQKMTDAMVEIVKPAIGDEAANLTGYCLLKDKQAVHAAIERNTGADEISNDDLNEVVNQAAVEYAADMEKQPIEVVEAVDKVEGDIVQQKEENVKDVPVKQA